MPDVAGQGEMPSALPVPGLPQVPLTLETLKIITPYALTLAMVGLLESLMTAAIVDEMTDTTSDKNRECAGQGLANITAGCFGGMAGCAMIGQSVINVSSGGRGRLSTFWAGGFLLFLIVVLGPYVAQIPMAALVAVTLFAAVGAPVLLTEQTGAARWWAAAAVPGVLLLGGAAVARALGRVPVAIGLLVAGAALVVGACASDANSLGVVALVAGALSLVLLALAALVRVRPTGARSRRGPSGREAEAGGAGLPLDPERLSGLPGRREEAEDAEALPALQVRPVAGRVPP